MIELIIAKTHLTILKILMSDYLSLKFTFLIAREFQFFILPSIS